MTEALFRVKWATGKSQKAWVIRVIRLKKKRVDIF